MLAPETLTRLRKCCFVQARAKKDAKQLAAATLLEYLLEVIPFQDLLYKSDKQQQLKDLQVSYATALDADFTRKSFWLPVNGAFHMHSAGNERLLRDPSCLKRPRCSQQLLCMAYYLVVPGHNNQS